MLASCREAPSRRTKFDGLDELALEQAVSAHGYDAGRICEHFGISRRHLERWFHRHMASSPGGWLAELRLQHARHLLATATSVKEVAYTLGFKQASQFSRDFKRRFGCQPSVERRAARQSGAASAGPLT